MNVFIRKMCILKQLKSGYSSDGRFLSGVVKVEYYGGALQAEVSLINFAPLSAGNYCCVISDKRGEAISFPVTEAGGSYSCRGKIDVSDGFWAAICYVDVSDYAAVACGVNGDNVYETGTLLLKLFGMKNGFAPAPAGGPPSGRVEPKAEPKTEPQAPAAPSEGALYDDERLSEENYYGFSSAGGKEDNLESESVLRVFKISDGDTYYKSVRSRLDEVFRSSPRDETLRGVFPHSVWVKSRTGELIGVITENLTVRYICCAVPADGREKKRVPKPGCYVPVSCFGAAEKYYISFQDADTGEFVSVAEG